MEEFHAVTTISFTRKVKQHLDKSVKKLYYLSVGEKEKTIQLSALASRQWQYKGNKGQKAKVVG